MCKSKRKGVIKWKLEIILLLKIKMERYLLNGRLNEKSKIDYKCRTRIVSRSN
jgi:hypothetical protein